MYRKTIGCLSRARVKIGPTVSCRTKLNGFPSSPPVSPLGPVSSELPLLLDVSQLAARVAGSDVAYSRDISPIAVETPLVFFKTGAFARETHFCRVKVGLIKRANAVVKL